MGYPIAKQQKVGLSIPTNYACFRQFRVDGKTVFGCVIDYNAYPYFSSEYFFGYRGYETNCCHIKPVGFDVDSYEYNIPVVRKHTEKYTRKFSLRTGRNTRADAYADMTYDYLSGPEAVFMHSVPLVNSVTITDAEGSYAVDYIVYDTYIYNYYLEDGLFYCHTIHTDRYGKTTESVARSNPQKKGAYTTRPYLDPLYEGILGESQSELNTVSTDLLLGEAINKAYYDAISASMMKMSDNSIQNIAEFATFLGKVIWAIRTGNYDIDLPKNFQSVWMQYRYSYSTSKLDAEEFMNFLKNKYQKASSKYHYSRTYGTSSFTFNGVDVLVRCRLKCATRKDLTGLEKALYQLWEHGLQPNLYVLWDTLPFSFVVDWSLPWGDIMKMYTDSEYLSTFYLDITGVVFSYSYTKKLADGQIVSYYRRWNSDPITIDPSYWAHKDTSFLTKAKRTVDSFCLVSEAIVPVAKRALFRT